MDTPSATELTAFAVDCRPPPMVFPRPLFSPAFELALELSPSSDGTAELFNEVVGILSQNLGWETHGCDRSELRSHPFADRACRAQNSFSDLVRHVFHCSSCGGCRASQFMRKSRKPSRLIHLRCALDVSVAAQGVSCERCYQTQASLDRRTHLTLQI